MDERDMLRSELSMDLSENVGRFKDLLRGDINCDAHFRSLRLSGVELCVVYIEGMTDDITAHDKRITRHGEQIDDLNVTVADHGARIKVLEEEERRADK